MNAETLEALKASIAKWEKNAEAENAASFTTNWRDCPLCLLFNGDDTSRYDRCKGCPVFEKTGERWCDGTPFGAATKARDTWLFGSKPDAERAHKAARAEVDFLKSLLPTETV